MDAEPTGATKRSDFRSINWICDDKSCRNLDASHNPSTTTLVHCAERRMSCRLLRRVHSRLHRSPSARQPGRIGRKPAGCAMKLSIANILFAICSVAIAIAWFCEHRRAGALQAEIVQLNSHWGPDYFAYAYHPNPDLSMFPNDPLTAVDSNTSNLFKALVMQSDAWSGGLNQYLGIDRIRSNLKPKITMTVWWHGEVMDADGNKCLVYLADRERSQAKSAARLHGAFSAYIVTDVNNSLLHWSGSDIDKSLVTEIEFSGETFPAELKYREESRHNSDSSIEVRKLSKSGIVK